MNCQELVKNTKKEAHSQLETREAWQTLEAPGGSWHDQMQKSLLKNSLKALVVQRELEGHMASSGKSFLKVRN